MLGAIAVFLGTIIDLITSWLADLSSRTFEGSKHYPRTIWESRCETGT